jgi:hypothetical protein
MAMGLLGSSPIRKDDNHQMTLTKKQRIAEIHKPTAVSLFTYNTCISLNPGRGPESGTPLPARAVIWFARISPGTTQITGHRTPLARLYKKLDLSLIDPFFLKISLSLMPHPVTMLFADTV